MTVGVLAFQGDFAEHMEVLRNLKVSAMEVRSLEDFARVEALIIPGGESTVMAKFLEETGVGKEIVRRASSEKFPIFGTCAGAILLANKTTGKNAQKPLKLIDITVDRNAYGTQFDSFEAAVKIKRMKKPLRVSFIRAPKITKVGKGVEVLAEYKGSPVLVRQGSVLVSAFHTEVRGEPRVHQIFLKMMKT